MALTEKNVYQVEITEDDHVQVRVKRIIMEDGVEISSSLHRHVVSPGDDYSGEIGKVRRMCQAAHVTTVITLRQTREAYREAKEIRDADPNPTTQAAVVVARDAYQAAQAAHEAFLLSEDA